MSINTQSTKLKDTELNTAVECFSAQLGEIAWHSVNIDSGFDGVSDEHSAYVGKFLADHGLLALGRPARFLEVSPYLHTTAQSLSRQFGVEAAACDISANTLRAGQQAYREKQSHGTATLVAADFHDLPFSTGYFDVVFIASAVHHTRRPKQVIDELLRVARPGGFVILYNEPVGSEGCFYSFRSNRLASLTPWESSIAEAGLMRIVCSPFPGSRPEQLFGMVENDRIPLNTYTSAQAEIIRLDLAPHPSELDLIFARQKATAVAIAAEINARLEVPRAKMGRPEQLMGFALPDEAEVNAFAQRYADALSAVESISSDVTPAVNESGNLRDHPLAAQSRLYGATLRMVLRKPGDAQAANQMFADGRTPDGDIMLSRPVVGAVRLRLTETTLPPILPEQAENLTMHFPVDQWSLYGQAPPFTQCLTGRSGRVELGTPPSCRYVLLLRYYAVAHAAGPYWIDIRAGDLPLDSAAICQSESRLLKLLLPEGCNEITLELREDGDSPMTFSWAVRVAYLDVIRCEPEPLVAE